MSVTRQRVRVAMVVLALAALGYVLYAAGSTLTPFLLGSVFVLVFAPVVDAAARALPFQRRHPDLALSVSIGLLYLAFTMAAVTAGVVWGPSLLGEGKDLANGLPSLVERAQREVQDNSGWYQRNVPPDIRGQIDQNVAEVARRAGQYSQDVISRTISFATTSVATVVSYLVVPFWAFFVLKDRRKGMETFVGLFPQSVQPDVQRLVANARTVFGSYIRAQLVLATVTGIITAVGLTWFGVRFSIALGLLAGVANLIPVIGPMLGGIPALIVVTATHPGWQILWVFLFLFVAQELKDFILVPRIQGRAVRIHPAIILILIVVAGHMAGFLGLLFAVPVAAVVRDTFVYVYRRLGDGPVPTLAAIPAAEGMAEEPDRTRPPAGWISPEVSGIGRAHEL